MNLLWITNIPLQPICEAMGMSVPAVGGWVYSSLKRIKNSVDGNIAVATVYAGNDLIEREVDGIRYYMLPLHGKPMIAYNKHLEPLWQQVNDAVKPDVIHIHGSEYPHGIAYVRACGNAGTVVSVQGIISAYCRYYALDGHDSRMYLTTPRDIVKGGIRAERRSFEGRGRLEQDLYRSVNHIIGRTEWDKAHAWAINPNAKYHYCGETLRDSFYNHKWEYDKCEPHSIFVSQGNYPIKGLHMLLKAMPLVLRQYPDTKVYVGGSNPTDRPWYLITGYGNYIKHLIKSLGLSGKIEFLGMLNEQQMCDRYLRSNVFVCPSAIENSPNSLGEAQMLGMPHLASFVGGVPEIVNYNEDVLYRYEEYEMLAKKICHIFAIANEFTPSQFDQSRYSGEANTTFLINAYKNILKGN